LPLKFRIWKWDKCERVSLKISGGGEELIDGESRRNSLRLQESQPKSLAIEVVSSQIRVAVSVDGTTVSRLQCSNFDPLNVLMQNNHRTV
jgi:hypothetical protein